MPGDFEGRGRDGVSRGSAGEVQIYRKQRVSGSGRASARVERLASRDRVIGVWRDPRSRERRRHSRRQSLPMKDHGTNQDMIALLGVVLRCAPTPDLHILLPPGTRGETWDAEIDTHHIYWGAQLLHSNALPHPAEPTRLFGERRGLPVRQYRLIDASSQGQSISAPPLNRTAVPGVAYAFHFAGARDTFWHSSTWNARSVRSKWRVLSQFCTSL